jgi:hypothetical protein
MDEILTDTPQGCTLISEYSRRAWGTFFSEKYQVPQPTCYPRSKYGIWHPGSGEDAADILVCCEVLWSCRWLSLIVQNDVNTLNTTRRHELKDPSQTRSKCCWKQCKGVYKCFAVGDSKTNDRIDSLKSLIKSFALSLECFSIFTRKPRHSGHCFHLRTHVAVTRLQQQMSPLTMSPSLLRFTVKSRWLSSSLQTQYFVWRKIKRGSSRKTNWLYYG